MLLTREKCLLSIDSYMAMFAYGVANTVILNTLFELKDYLHSSLQDTSFGLVVSSAAHVVGFILCEFKWIHSSHIVKVIIISLLLLHTLHQ